MKLGNKKSKIEVVRSNKSSRTKGCQFCWQSFFVLIFKISHDEGIVKKIERRGFNYWLLVDEKI